MSQFIIVTNSASVVQRNIITEYVKSKKWGYWHHFEDFWMVATSELGQLDYDATTSEQIWKELSSYPAIGKADLLVIRLPTQWSSMTHFGYGNPNGWEWTKKYWSGVG